MCGHGGDPVGAGRVRISQPASLSGLPKPDHDPRGRTQTCSLGAPQTLALVALRGQTDNAGKAKRYQGPSS